MESGVERRRAALAAKLLLLAIVLAAGSILFILGIEVGFARAASASEAPPSAQLYRS